MTGVSSIALLTGSGTIEPPAVKPNQIGPLGVKPKTACVMLDCGITRLYQLLKEQKLISYRDGRSRKILVSSINEYVERKLGKEAA